MSIQDELTPSPASRERAGVRAEISLDAIILQVTGQVIRELADRGVRVVSAAGSADAGTSGFAPGSVNSSIRSERADMTGYRSPVLTERHVRKLHELTGTVIVPRGTVLSPKALELLRDRNIQLRIE
jgi:hypothetical protein